MGVQSPLAPLRGEKSLDTKTEREGKVGFDVLNECLDMGWMKYLGRLL
jgi:hypothetical protein